MGAPPMGNRSTHGCWEPPHRVTETLWGLREHPWVTLWPLMVLWVSQSALGLISAGSTHGCQDQPQGTGSTHGCWEPPQGVTQTLWGLGEHPWVPLGPPWAHRGHTL